MELAVVWIKRRLTGNEVCICFELRDCHFVNGVADHAGSVIQSSPVLKWSRRTTQTRKWCTDSLNPRLPLTRALYRYSAFHTFTHSNLHYWFPPGGYFTTLWVSTLHNIEQQGLGMKMCPSQAINPAFSWRTRENHETRHSGQPSTWQIFEPVIFRTRVFDNTGTPTLIITNFSIEIEICSG